jgi:hypothetical protein
VNVVSQSFAVKHELERVQDAALLGVKLFQGTKGYYYGAYTVSIRVADSQGAEPTTKGIFYSIDIEDDALILGRL